MRLTTRLKHWGLALRSLPGLLCYAEQRNTLAHLRQFVRRLPHEFQAPVPQAMQKLTPSPSPNPNLSPDTLRRLADLAALLERNSPLGICLRRSLVRYYVLRRAGLPLCVQFGAKLDGPQPSQRNLSGHAWVTLNERPYFEADENWRNFQVMFTWPQQA